MPLNDDIVFIVPSGAVGHCPLCQRLLRRYGENLVCEGGDYIVLESEFDRIWDQYPPDRLKAEEPTAGESLLQELIKENIKIFRFPPDFSQGWENNET
jgi:hypothetical protein